MSAGAANQGPSANRPNAFRAVPNRLRGRPVNLNLPARPIPRDSSMFHPHYVTLSNGQSVLLRYVEPNDAEALLAHVNEVGAERVHIMTERVLQSPEEEAEQLRRLDREKVLFLVGATHGAIVASADVHRGTQVKSAHTGNLGIAIRKEFRGVGLGTAIMEDIVRWSRSVGIRKLTLGVFATNAPAIALYRRFGFEEEARLKNQVLLDGKLVDEILMARWL